ncbi:MAG: hypothetical protein HRU46_00275 [Verrucomicrobiales bacterium]|nr:hypothetical protein [Verrucomicrobiales bacterium]
MTPEPATTLVGASSATQQVAELPSPEPMVPAAVAPVTPESVADSNYSTEEIIVESKSISAPEPEPVIAPDSLPRVVLPEPMTPPVETVDAETTAPIPVPQPPKAPVSTGGVVAPPAPVIPDNIPAAIQHDVITPIPPEPAEEPPAVAKTQPIKINPRPSSLPPVREADTSVPGELPRLDTSLAGQGDNAADTLTPEEEPEPTKLVLPMPGDTTEQFTPGDFIVPTHTSDEGLAEIEEEINELPDFSDLEEPVEAIEPITPIIPVTTAPPAAEELAPEPAPRFPAPIGEVVAPLDEVIEEPVEAGEPLVEETIEVPEPVVPASLVRGELAVSIDELEVSEEEPSISMDELEVEPLEPKTGPLETAQNDLTSELGLEPVVEVEVVEGPPAEDDSELGDDFDQFISGVDSPGDGSSDVKARLDLDELSSSGAEESDPILDIFAESEEEEQPKASLSEGSFESLLSEQAEPEQQGIPKPRKLVIPLKAPRAPEAEVAESEEVPEKIAATNELDEMFCSSSGSGKSGGPSRTAVVMLSAIGAVAIIAVVVVVLLINALGGIDVATPEPEVEPPPPAIANGPESLASSNPGMTPGFDSPGGEAPTSISSPVPPTMATELTEPPATTENPIATVPPAPPVENPPVEPIPVNNGAADATVTGEEGDAPAMSFDERVLSIVNGDFSPEGVGNAGPTSLSPTEMANSAASEFVTAVGDNAPGVAPLVGVPDDQLPTAVAEGAASPAARSVSNYNPEDSFPAPTSPDDLLGRTHDLLDAYLRAPDWETRMKYVYRGDSLRPSIEEYYQKWPFKQLGTFSKVLFQMEPNKEIGGPYWVYLISTSDNDSGFPMIIREEDGLLKVDWEVFSEFQDEHFVKFLAGDIPSPHTLRVVINRVSDYYGPDRDGFTNLDDYFVYQVNPPYGGLNEFSTYAFVKKDSPIAARFEEVVSLNEDALAVIITMEEKAFPHGINHYVVTDYITEGWFR